MSFDKLMPLACTIVLATAGAGLLPDLQMWIWRKQAEVAWASRTSTWSSPRFFVGSASRQRDKPTAKSEQIVSREDLRSSADAHIGSPLKEEVRRYAF